MTRLMLWTILITFLLILGGVLAQLMQQDAGVMMITWNGWMVETTFWSGIAGILSTVVLVVFLVAIIRKFGPGRLLSSYRNRRDQNTARKETAIAIESWLKGTDDRALKALERVVSSGGSGRLPAAVSLAIGLNHGDWPDRYAQFIADDPELKLFAKALQAERLWQAGKMQEFSELIKGDFDLRQIPWLRERLWQILIQQGEAINVVPMINEVANIQPESREQWLINTVESALQQSQGKAELGHKALKALSKPQKQTPAIVRAEVNYLISLGDHTLAFKRIKQMLSAINMSESADLLLDVQIDNVQKLNLLESVLVSNPGPVFCRAQGVVNLQQQLWGNAQGWLEKGWQQGDRICGLKLAELMEQRKMHEQAGRLFKELAIGGTIIKKGA